MTSTTALAARAAPSPDQCRNGAVNELRTDCAWADGSLNPQNAQYTEGDLVALRVTLDDLEVGRRYQLTIAHGLTRKGAVAYDHVGSWDCTESGAPAPDDPTSTVDVPDDPRVANAGLTDQSGGCDDRELAMWGGVLEAPGPYAWGGARGPEDGVSADTPLSTGDDYAYLPVVFVAAASEVTLAWGLHIATRDDWGPLGHDTALATVEGNIGFARLAGDLEDLTADEFKRVGTTMRTMQGHLPKQAAADLRLAKAADPAGPVGPDDEVTWVLTATNEGDAPTEAFTIVDDVPAGFAVGEVTPATCTVDVQLVQCPFNGLEPGGEQVVTVTTTAPSQPGSCRSWTNTASATSSEDLQVEASAAVLVEGCAPGLSIEKEAAADEVELDTTAQWTITVANEAGASADGEGLAVVDELTDAFTLTSVTTTSGTCDADEQTLSCQLDPLAPGGLATITLTADVTDEPNSCGRQENIAVLLQDDAFLQLSNAGEPVAVEVVGCAPAITVTQQTRQDGPVEPGGFVDVVAEVANSGTLDTTVEVVPEVPEGWGVAGFTADGTPCEDGVCVVDLPAGESVTIGFSFEVPDDPNECGAHELATRAGDAVGSSSVQVCEPAPRPLPPTPVRAPQASPDPDLDLTKGGSHTTAGIGDAVTWTYTVANSGDTVLDDVALTDVVESGRGSTTLTIIDVADGLSLDPGESVTVTATWTVEEADLPGPLSNVATATATAGAVSLEATDRWSIDLESAPAITLTKSADAREVTIGEGERVDVTFQHVITNIGDVTLAEITLEDGDLGTLTLPVTTLAPGESTVVETVVTVTEASVLDGVATVTALPSVGDAVGAQDDAVVEVVVVEVLGETIERPTTLPAPDPAPEPEAPTLPATGGGLGLAGIGLALLAGRRRRHDASRR